MSVWQTQPIDPETKFSSIAVIGVAIFVVGLALWQMPPSEYRSATGLDALIRPSPTQSPSPTEGEFSVARDVSWEGHVRRVFLGGGALEVVSRDAPGGVFQAYMPDDGIASVSEGPVRISGSWRGYTCAYGGDNGRCVPDVTINHLQQLPIASE
jgi:hypothetical protein